MTYGNMYKQYRRANIETAGKLDLIIMCYEKAIQLLTQAKGHYLNNEIEKKATKMQKAINIINELKGCLNLKEGGQIAVNLDAIYTYLNKRLLLGDIKKDLSVFDESINILAELKSAWMEISNEKNSYQSIPDTPGIPQKRFEQIAA